MDNTKKVRVNIVNRDYPPYKGITGESAAELAKYLIDAGIEVNVIHVDSSFQGKSGVVPAGNIFKVNTLYNGENKILRLFANLLSGYFLIRKSKKIPCDLTIVMTDPSLLNMWAALLLKKRKWILWAMDLYPEAFAAWGLVSAKSFLYKWFYRLTVKNAPQAIISLGPLQTDFLKKRYNNKPICFFQIPCGIFDMQHYAASEMPQWAADGSKIRLGYVGNLGAPHSLDFLYAIVDHLDTEKFKLVLSVYGYGEKVQSIKQYVNGKKGIEIIPPVKREHLKYIDIHLASLFPQCTHISVPSKTVSSVCAGSAFLYNGEAESDNWQLLQKAGWLITYTGDVEEDTDDFFQRFDTKELERKKETAKELAKTLNAEKMKVFQDLATYIQTIAAER
ncbi:MAG: hypothetical protein LBC98_01355 [Prevotellaceae bacterium]|jgi:hypothetical protein|nr:hypothetical protein [Prevotellaceae bacterium]